MEKNNNDIEEYRGFTQRDMLIRLQAGQDHMSSELKEVKNQLHKHKDEIWIKVREHDEYITSQKATKVQGLSIWQVVVAVVLVGLAALEVYALLR